MIRAVEGAHSVEVAKGATTLGEIVRKRANPSWSPPILLVFNSIFEIIFYGKILLFNSMELFFTILFIVFHNPSED